MNTGGFEYDGGSDFRRVRVQGGVVVPSEKPRQLFLLVFISFQFNLVYFSFFYFTPSDPILLLARPGLILLTTKTKPMNTVNN